MTEYAIMLDIITGEPSVIVRAVDFACIPFDPENRDYQTYLAWVDDGGVADTFTPGE